eukprot:6204745-Amphidinium_carterae.3
MCATEHHQPFPLHPAIPESAQDAIVILRRCLDSLRAYLDRDSDGSLFRPFSRCSYPKHVDVSHVSMGIMGLHVQFAGDTRVGVHISLLLHPQDHVSFSFSFGTQLSLLEEWWTENPCRACLESLEQQHSVVFNVWCPSKQSWWWLGARFCSDATLLVQFWMAYKCMGVVAMPGGSAELASCC